MQNKNRKNKKLTEGEGFTLAQEQPLGLSIGALLGVPQKEPKAKNAEKKAEPQAAPAAPPKISKVALQRQRAGRGGKTVTLVILPQDYEGDTAGACEGAAQGARLRLDDRGRENRPSGRHRRPRRGVVCQKRRDEDHEKRLKRVIYI